MYIEIHLLQSFAPSNLNRDDTGSPKDCQFGGARRARISSQCLKRAIRTHPAFERAIQVPLGQRTRRLVKLVRERLEKAEKPKEQAERIAAAFVTEYASKLDPRTTGEDKETQTAVLIYISESELQDITQALLAEWDNLVAKDEKGLASEIVRIARPITRAHQDVTGAPDIALFGRMLAEKPELGLDAACQVAHALSTHPVTVEMDFYTAVDDLLERDEPGAGMMGVTGYDSACYYRYARIDWNQLVKNLKDDAELARKAVDGFLQASLYAVPSGKQNSHAAFNPPSLALAVVRQDGMAWNLANAFEQPVRPGREGGYVAPSLRALDAYWGALCAAYGQESLQTVAALRCDLGETELVHLAGSLAANETAWRQAVLNALPNGG